MLADERPVERVAAAILDGTPIDWAAAEAGATDEERLVLDELRLLCTVADLHRVGATDQELFQARDEHGDLQFWGRLRLIERVGAGTFGEVYRAWDPRLHREVALKLIPASDDSAGDRAAAMIREGRLMARVRHPGVVTIYDAEQLGTHVGLCMEFVEGPTLEQRVAREGCFTPAETVAIGVQLCEALRAVHGAGVLHRDVKPSNVVIRPDGRIVLMDFGAGTRLGDLAAADPTGTPLYVAPEVLQGEEATVRSDVYSVGVVLHRMLTGSYPVPAQSLAGLRAAHAKRREAGRDSASGPNPRVPPRLAAVLDRALDVHPGRRHANVDALARDLRALQRPRRRVPLAAMAAALVAVTAVAASFMWAPAGVGDRHDAGQTLTARAREPLRIAVLPFSVEGEPADTDALRTGIANDVIGRLRTFENARVISMASVFSIDTRNLSMAEIGARLNVSALVTGHLVYSSGAMTADVAVVNVAGERTVWSQRYTRPPSELLDLQRAIALDVAGTLRLERRQDARDWPTRNPEAYALYVRGRTALDSFTQDGTRLALQLFEQALSLDPGYAQVHAGIAQVFLQMNSAIPNTPRHEALRRATDAAATALAIDGLLPEAFVATAGLKSTHGDWSGAEQDFRRAIELAPSSVHARQQYAHWLTLHGRFDEGLEQARMAESLDPLSPRSIMAVASSLRFARRFEEAIIQAQKALAIDSGYPAAYLNLGHNFQGLGRLDEAIAAFERTGRPSGNLGNAYAQAGRIREARALLAQFEERYARTGLGAGELAQIYIGLGDHDRAFEWLARMDQDQAGWPSTLKVALVWDPLRADPRFKALLAQHHLID